MRAGDEKGPGLVEADVPVPAKPQDHQIDATGARDGTLVPPAFGLRIGRVAVQEVKAS